MLGYSDRSCRTLKEGRWSRGTNPSVCPSEASVGRVSVSFENALRQKLQILVARNGPTSSKVVSPEGL